MRSTVLVLDALIYIPALLMFTRTWQATRSKRTQVLYLLTGQKENWLTLSSKNLALLILLLQPALLLVDFGHFQYNSVMLGRPCRMCHPKGVSHALTRLHTSRHEFFC